MLLVGHSRGVPLLRNDMQTGNWIALRLHGTGLGVRQIGVGGTVRIGEVSIWRAVGDASYLAQHGATQHLGLGPAERVVGLTVQWAPGDMD